RFDQSFRCRHYSLLLFDQYFSVPRAVSSVVESAGAATGVTHTTARVADSAELRLRSEIENHARAQHDQQKSDEEQRIRRGLRRVINHSDQHVDNRRAAEHQRHYVSRQAAAFESQDDADRADGAEGAGDRRRRRAEGVPSLAVQLYLRIEHGDRDDDADQKVGDSDAEQRAKRAAELDLPLMQHRAVNSPREGGADGEHNPKHRAFFLLVHFDPELLMCGIRAGFYHDRFHATDLFPEAIQRALRSHVNLTVFDRARGEG